MGRSVSAYTMEDVDQEEDEVVDNEQEDDNILEIDENDNNDEIDIGDDMTIPDPTSPEWNDYVLTKFSPQEMQFDSPTVDGLRRVAELLLGEIENVDISLVQESSSANAYHAIARCSMLIGGKYYSDLGDAMREGLQSGNIYRVSAAVAATRAEARVLRKALRLSRGIIAAEEKEEGANSVEDSGNTGEQWEEKAPISSAQIATIDHLMKRYDVNGDNFLLHAGSKPYNSIKELTKSDGSGVIKALNEYGKEGNSVPASLKGYKQGWIK